MAERKAFLLRLRPEVHAALQRWAAEEFRSVNAQIEYLLEQSLRAAGRRSRRSSGAPDTEPPDAAGEA